MTPSRVPEVTCERGFSIEPDLRVDPHKKLRNQARIHIRQYDIFEFFFFILLTFLPQAISRIEICNAFWPNSRPFSLNIFPALIYY